MGGMCGRYSLSRTRRELIEQFHVQLDAAGDAVRPDYNIAPTKEVLAVLARPPQEETHAAEASVPAVRQLRALRWGLVPSWAKDVKIGNRLINARAETVHEKPSFRRAFAKRRCLLPADGFYEWYTMERNGGRPAKQPFFIRPRDGAVMAMAGLYELWRSPEDDQWLWTCTIITTQASDDVGRIHDRMPMVVRPDDWDAWLDPALTDVARVRDLLTPAMSGTMEAYPVSRAVNNVKNNGPELLQPLTDGHIPGENSGSGTLF
ncbi:protein of unknown function DUF159 [Thermomonospora curvata DSM 43183]|uniref:Abasic site processing protein n=2 Tax=Thermomonospora curvata TaxID=2020 RepID=D1ACI5_THECD|nr:protein of unknown function DUF159 [Thermomonospora curvata DSM 43183]